MIVFNFPHGLPILRHIAFLLLPPDIVVHHAASGNSYGVICNTAFIPLALGVLTNLRYVQESQLAYDCIATMHFTFEDAERGQWCWDGTETEGRVRNNSYLDNAVAWKEQDRGPILLGC